MCEKICESRKRNDTEKVVADAGPDKTTIVGSYATLDASYSKGDTVWYEWKGANSNPEETNISIYSGSIAEIDSSCLYPELGFDKKGTYKFYLDLKKEFNSSKVIDSDTVIVEIKANPNSKFEDPNLELEIRYSLGNKKDVLTQNELLSLDSLLSSVLGDEIVSLKGIEHCENLVYLNMALEKISNISPISELEKLEELNLSQNHRIKDITPLKNLTNLKHLVLDENLISDISPLANLVNLEYLELSYNPINSINALGNLSKLKTLYLAKSRQNAEGVISDLSPISKCKKLEQLWITGFVNVKDISCLKTLTNIENLNITWCKVESIEALSYMEELERLRLDQNQISDITPLKNLSELNYVRLWDNQIKDISSLVENKNIDKGDVVGLDGNPLSEKSIEVYIPKLKKRGVYVTY